LTEAGGWHLVPSDFPGGDAVPDYTVAPMKLWPIPDVHQGTGKQTARVWVVDATSVPPPGRLRFVPANVETTTLLFQISSPVVPNWFGVAVPSGIKDFSSANLFFHPLPGQAGYVDADYAGKTGKWPELFYYLATLGQQVDVAQRDQVVIMPFLTSAVAGTTGIFPETWQSLVPQILGGTRAAITGSTDGSTVAVSSVVVSSFSAGISYSNGFRTRATGLSGLLREVWDLDGSLSPQYGYLSQALWSTSAYKVIKYDQAPSNDQTSFHVPLARWADCPNHPANFLQVHGLIRDYMFLHAASMSNVGVRSTNR
jgi:hypothetical protein